MSSNQPIQANNTATILVATGDTWTVGNVISGNSSGGLSLGNAGNLGTVVLSGSNSYQGNTTITGGTVSISANSSLGNTTSPGTLIFGGGTLAVTANVTSNQAIQANTTGTILVATSNTWTETGVMSGNSSGGVALGNTSKAGTVVLGGTNTYTGNTTINGGTVSIGANSSLGCTTTPGTLIFGGGTLAVTANVTSNQAIQANTTGTILVANTIAWTETGVISGNNSGSLALGNTSKAGTVVLNGTNTYTGNTTIDGGTVSIGANSSLGCTTSPGTLIFAGGTLAVTANVTSNQTIQANSTATILVATGNTWTETGVISGNSSGGLSLGNASNLGTVVLGGTNTYTGNTAINGGTVSISANSSLGCTTSPGSIVFGSGGTLAVTANVTSNQAIQANTTGTILVASGNTWTETGVISGNSSGGLSLRNASNLGTVVLGGSNTYTGNTTINGGTVSISANSSLGNTTSPGTIVFGSGGTLAVTANVTSNQAIQANTTGTILVASGNTWTETGVISGNSSGGLSLGNASNLGTVVLSGSNSYQGNTTITGGTVSIGADNSLGCTSIRPPDFRRRHFGRHCQCHQQPDHPGQQHGDDPCRQRQHLDGNGRYQRQQLGGLSLGNAGNLGTVVLGGSNSYQGNTTITGGTVSISANSSLGNTTSPGSIVFGSGGTLAVTANVTSNQTIQANTTATILVANTFAWTETGVVSGNSSGGLAQGIPAKPARSCWAAPTPTPAIRPSTAARCRSVPIAAWVTTSPAP